MEDLVRHLGHVHKLRWTRSPAKLFELLSHAAYVVKQLLTELRVGNAERRRALAINGLPRRSARDVRVLDKLLGLRHLIGRSVDSALNVVEELAFLRGRVPRSDQHGLWVESRCRLSGPSLIRTSLVNRGLMVRKRLLCISSVVLPTCLGLADRVYLRVGARGNGVKLGLNLRPNIWVRDLLGLDGHAVGESPVGHGALRDALCLGFELLVACLARLNRKVFTHGNNGARCFHHSLRRDVRCARSRLLGNDVVQCRSDLSPVIALNDRLGRFVRRCFLADNKPLRVTDRVVLYGVPGRYRNVARRSPRCRCLAHDIVAVHRTCVVAARSHEDVRRRIADMHGTATHGLHRDVFFACGHGEVNLRWGYTGCPARRGGYARRWTLCDCARWGDWCVGLSGVDVVVRGHKVWRLRWGWGRAWQSGIRIDRRVSGQRVIPRLRRSARCGIWPCGWGRSGTADTRSATRVANKQALLHKVLYGLTLLCPLTLR